MKRIVTFSICMYFKFYYLCIERQCLCWVSIAVRRPGPNRTSGGKVYFVLYFESNQGGNSSTVGTWKQKLKQGPQRTAAFWIAPSGFLCLLSYKLQNDLTCLPRAGTMCSGLGPLKSIVYEENTLQNCLQTIWLETFSQLSFLFPDNSSCVNVAKKNLTRTQDNTMYLWLVWNSLYRIG